MNTISMGKRHIYFDSLKGLKKKLYCFFISHGSLGFVVVVVVVVSSSVYFGVSIKKILFIIPKGQMKIEMLFWKVAH